MGKVSASKRKAQTEQPEGLEKVSAGKRDAEEMITTTIEQITKRRRMTAVEREALQISCDRCGQQFSRPQDLKRHNSLMPQCGTVKRRMTVAERAKLPFKCILVENGLVGRKILLATSVRVHRARLVVLKARRSRSRRPTRTSYSRP